MLVRLIGDLGLLLDIHIKGLSALWWTGGRPPDSNLIRFKWWLAENEWVMLCITMLLHKVLHTEEATIDFQPGFHSSQSSFTFVWPKSFSNAVLKSQTVATLIWLMPRWSVSVVLCVKDLVKSWVPLGSAEDTALFTSPVDNSEFKNGLKSITQVYLHKFVKVTVNVQDKKITKPKKNLLA